MTTAKNDAPSLQKGAEHLLGTTGIGSLPHHNVDAALEFSFRMGIPFLPQIPIRNPWEYMIAQALEGLPGLSVESDGSVSLNLAIWESRAHGFGKNLSQAFERAASDAQAFEAYEPSTAVSSSWQPFLWEVEERGLQQAKVQIAGPMTSQWALKTKDGTAADRVPELSSQIYRLVLARALAMARRLKAQGVSTPILYLDEPGLYGLSSANPKHLMALQELKIMIQTLRKEGVTVGLHCCSNTDWTTVLSLGLDILSLDAGLSLTTLLGHRPALEDFLEGGGKLSLGVIPTVRSSVLHSLKVSDLFEGLVRSLDNAWPSKPDVVRKIVGESMYTPACGLAYHSVADAELVLEALSEFHEQVRKSVG